MIAVNSLQKVVYLTSSLYLLALIAYGVLRLVYGDGLWWLSLLNTFSYALLLPLVILLPLALLARVPQTVLQLIPVLVVGGIWLAPYYMPKTIPVVTGTPLKVLNSNVWGNNHDLTAVEQWLRDQDADIILLQEISPAYSQENMPGLADMYPYQVTHADYSRWGSNTTLSRYPVISTDLIDLEGTDSSDIIRLVLDVHGQPVAVYNVHLAWPGGPGRLRLPFDNAYLNMALGFNDDERNLQVTQLIDLLANEPYPYILGGDFNTSDHTATYQQLAAQFEDAFLAAGSGMGKTWPVSTARGIPGIIPPLVRIDYIWHSSHFQAQSAEVGPPIGSDHLPVIAQLVLVNA